VSRRQKWNERYSASELVWGAEPNRFLAEEPAAAEPGESGRRTGRALDLACGEGRNAIWLASLGWRVTGVDFSDVAIARARERAEQAGVGVDWVRDDVTHFEPEPGAFSLVVVLYLQIPAAERRLALAHAARALVSGGRLLAIGHALRNLEAGVGGPQDPAVLWDPAALAAELEALGLEVDRREELERATDEGTAIDVRVRARRP
jgi:SAM-dependent methyltransferase